MNNNHDEKGRFSTDSAGGTRKLHHVILRTTLAGKVVDEEKYNFNTMRYAKSQAAARQQDFRRGAENRSQIKTVAVPQYLKINGR